MILAVLLSTVVLSPIRVACVGDSITQGREGFNCYPAYLQLVLGEKYFVGNFGRSSTSVSPGRLQYQALSPFQDAINFKPNVVLLMLGTNDSPGSNWAERRDIFRESYLNLVNSLKQLKPKPRIVVLLPPPMFFANTDWRPKNLVNEIIPIETEIAKQERCEIFDAFTLFRDKPKLFPDKLHPSNLGFMMLAQQVAREIFPAKPVACPFDWDSTGVGF